MAEERRDLSARPSVPDPRREIPTCGRDVLVVGTEHGVLHGRRMPPKMQARCPFFDVPHDRGAVVAGRHELLAARIERDRFDRASVSRQCVGFAGPRSGRR
jgi:hypothetical protein